PDRVEGIGTHDADDEREPLVVRHLLLGFTRPLVGWRLHRWSLSEAWSGKLPYGFCGDNGITVLPSPPRTGQYAERKNPARRAPAEKRHCWHFNRGAEHQDVRQAFYGRARRAAAGEMAGLAPTPEEGRVEADALRPRRPVPRKCRVSGEYPGNSGKNARSAWF